jgi:VanZ family protein
VAVSGAFDHSSRSFVYSSAVCATRTSAVYGAAGNGAEAGADKEAFMNGYRGEGAQLAADGIPGWPFRWLLLAAICAISWLAFTPPAHGVAVQGWDKLNHAAAFYVLALLLDFSSPRTRCGVGKVLVLLAYGVAIEAVQYFIPAREASLNDLFADAVGVLAYVCSIPLLARIPPLDRHWRRRDR